MQAPREVAGVPIAAPERAEGEAGERDPAGEVEDDGQLGAGQEDVEDLGVGALDHPPVGRGQAGDDIAPDLRRGRPPAGSPEHGVEVAHGQVPCRAHAAGQDGLPGASRPEDDDPLHLTHPPIMR